MIRKAGGILLLLLLAAGFACAGLAEDAFYVTPRGGSAQTMHEVPADFPDGGYWMPDAETAPEKTLEIGPVGTAPRTVAAFRSETGGMDYTLLVPRIPERLRAYLDAEGYSVIQLLADDRGQNSYLGTICNRMIVVYDGRMGLRGEHQPEMEMQKEYYALLLYGNPFFPDPARINGRIAVAFTSGYYQYTSYVYAIKTDELYIEGGYGSKTTYLWELEEPDDSIVVGDGFLSLSDSLTDRVIQLLTVQNRHFGQPREKLIRDKEITLVIR